jgi:hypothetical protein
MRITIYERHDSKGVKRYRSATRYSTETSLQKLPDEGPPHHTGSIKRKPKAQCPQPRDDYLPIPSDAGLSGGFRSIRGPHSVSILPPIQRNRVSTQTHHFCGGSWRHPLRRQGQQHKPEKGFSIPTGGGVEIFVEFANKEPSHQGEEMIALLKGCSSR